MADPFRLALGQPPGDLPTPRTRVDWLTATLSDLKGKGIDLLSLPELFLSGYNIGSAIGERAEAADGPLAREIAVLAAHFGIAIHYGYAERDGGKLYSAAQCFGPDGARLGGHRKLVIPPGFEVEHYAAGAGCSLFTLGTLRIGTLICYDAEFPEAVRHVAALGADLVVIPTALAAQWDWVSRTVIPARAYENGLFLAYANHAGCENGLAYLGSSFIAAPDGVELARAGAAPEVLIADLDPQRVIAARLRLPYLTDCRRLRLSDGPAVG